MQELTAEEQTALDMLAKAADPYVRRTYVDLIAGRGVVDSLEAAKLVKCWTTMVIDERRELSRVEKSTDARTGKKREKTVHLGWRPTRARRMTFVALTSLGHDRLALDLFERGDCGPIYQAQRRKDEHGAWMLPDTPIKSTGRPGAQLCEDQLPDQADEGRGKRAG